MDLRQLNYFVVIAERRNFTAAAQVLHIAQSALSRQMTMLEDEVGGPLFERHARGVTLTEAGELLLQRARFVLAQVADTKAELLAQHGELRGTVRLAAPSSVSQALYVPLARQMLSKYPRVRLQLSEGTTAGVTARLLEGSLDAAIVTEPPPNDHVDLQLLFEEPVVLVGRAGDPRLSRSAVRPQLLRELPLMLAPGLMRMLGTAADGVEPVLQVDSTAPMLALVLAGHGYAVMPACTMAAAPAGGKQLAFARIQGLRMRRYIALPRGRGITRATQETLRQVQETIAQLSAFAARPAAAG